MVVLKAHRRNVPRLVRGARSCIRDVVNNVTSNVIACLMALHRIAQGVIVCQSVSSLLLADVEARGIIPGLIN